MTTNPGKAVQVDPIEPKLQQPGTKCLKLKHDGLLSTFGFKINFRRFTLALMTTTKTAPTRKMSALAEAVAVAAGAYTRSPFSLT